MPVERYDPYQQHVGELLWPAVYQPARDPFHDRRRFTVAWKDDPNAKKLTRASSNFPPLVTFVDDDGNPANDVAAQVFAQADVRNITRDSMLFGTPATLTLRDYVMDYLRHGETHRHYGVSLEAILINVRELRAGAERAIDRRLHK